MGRTVVESAAPSTHSAHPHVRGEDVDQLAVLARVLGSPPRAWGGLNGRGDLHRESRLTPTCVGRTPAGEPPLRCCTAHPHVRGEDRRSAAAAPGLAGSPPRAWGGRGDPRSGVAGARLTPTCVGRTGSLGRSRATGTAHPHVRGEDVRRTRVIWQATGSPPRAWGGPRSLGDALGADRLTPTCVGRTSAHPWRSQRSPAHPHVRGEDFSKPVATTIVSGSPPRAWGGPPPGISHLLAQRLTPTCVGRTSWRPPTEASNAAHPHVRGEDFTLSIAELTVDGSPPRAWGGPNRGRDRVPRPRLTPTCVGRTLGADIRQYPEAAHPHVRGEDDALAQLVDDLHGSPPRAWGGLAYTRRPDRRRRLTPTCVGRTASPLSPPR